jgi:signal transduction protein with GAF and PtsI domain
VFEREMLKETGEYYRRESAELMAENVCSVYIQKVTITVHRLQATPNWSTEQ